MSVPRLRVAHGAGDVPAVPPPVPARDVRCQGCAGARFHPAAPVAAPAVPQVSAAPSSIPQLQGLSQQCHGAVPGPWPLPVLTSFCQTQHSHVPVLIPVALEIFLLVVLYFRQVSKHSIPQTEVVTNNFFKVNSRIFFFITFYRDLKMVCRCVIQFCCKHFLR